MPFIHIAATTCRPFLVLSGRQTSFLPIMTPLSMGQDIGDQLLLFKQHIHLFVIHNHRNIYVFIILIFMRALAGWQVASSCKKYKVRTLKNKIKSMSVKNIMFMILPKYHQFTSKQARTLHMAANMCTYRLYLAYIANLASVRAIQATAIN